MHVAVLGAGVIGVTTAYFLQKSGHKVTVIERQPKSAMECSFANGGQLSYSHGEPWASPHSLKKALQWMFKEDAPLKLGFRLDPAMWRWTAKFMLHCTNEAALRTTEVMLRLGLYSRGVMRRIENEQPLAFHYTKTGILHVFETEQGQKRFAEHAEFQVQYGTPCRTLSVEECVAKEPALRHAAPHLAGGVYFPLDEQGDIFHFTQNLAAHLEQQGVTFLYETAVTSLHKENGKITRVTTNREPVEADAFVMCLGAYSPLLLNPVGVRIPVYPMKGYSISVPLQKGVSPDDAPSMSLTDHGHKVVFSRLGDRLRLAGTAEFAGYDHTIRERRIALLKRVMQHYFPRAGNLEEAAEWACLRPSTPAGPPILGASAIDNLYLNTGHGTLGWTQAAGSAKIVADIINGKTPEISLDGLRLR